MTKNEFLELYDKFLNPEMRIGEYHKLRDAIGVEVKNALTIAYERFSIFVKDVYDIDYDFSPKDFLKISSDRSTRDEMCIEYSYYDSVRFTKIPLYLIASWVDGDFNDLIEKSYSKVKISLENDIANCTNTIKKISSEIDDARKILDEIAMNESNEGTVDKTIAISKYWDFLDNYAI